MKKIILLFLTATISVAGKSQLSGNCLKLTADSQYVEIPDATSNSLNNKMTIEMWVFYSCVNDTSSTEMITKGWCGSTWSYYFGIDHQRLHFQKRIGGGCGGEGFAFYSTDNPVINFNVWTHVAVVINDATLNFYVNGKLVASSLTDGSSFAGVQPSTEPIRIGTYRGLGNNLAGVPKGNLDDIRIWHTARTQAQIANNYNKELSGKESALYCYWKLNESGEGSGIKVINSAVGTGTDFDGITMGAISFKNTSSVLSYFPCAKIKNKSILEGDSGTKQLIFPVTLSNAYNDTVKINYKTKDKSAKAESDYNEKSGIIVFNPGDTLKKISVDVYGDTEVENNEHFDVILSHPIHTIILGDTAIGTIRNDDGAALTDEFSIDEKIKSTSLTPAFKIYPNPVKAILYIQSKQNVRFSLTDVTGKTVITKQINGNGNIDVLKLPAGIYFLRNNITVEVQKIIVQK